MVNFKSRLWALPTLFAATVMLLPTSGLAQEIEGVAISPGSTLLTLSATGESERKPDIATFSAGIETRAKTASAALAENAAVMNRLFKTLKASGIAERDIQTSNLSISPLYAPSQNRDGYYDGDENRAITGYKVTNIVTVRQRDIINYGQLIDTLVGAGANNVNGPNFSLDKPGPAQDEALADAIAKARSQAELYAEGVGMRVKRIVSISGGGPMYARGGFMNEAALAPSPIAAGELTITASVNIAFELAPS